jgi:hypothetical protein
MMDQNGTAYLVFQMVFIVVSIFSLFRGKSEEQRLSISPGTTYSIVHYGYWRVRRAWD